MNFNCVDRWKAVSILNASVFSKNKVLVKLILYRTVSQAHKRAGGGGGGVYFLYY